jgi:hypothetical protein
MSTTLLPELVSVCGGGRRHTPRSHTSTSRVHDTASPTSIADPATPRIRSLTPVSPACACG